MRIKVVIKGPYQGDISVCDADTGSPIGATKIEFDWDIKGVPRLRIEVLDFEAEVECKGSVFRRHP